MRVVGPSHVPPWVFVSCVALACVGTFGQHRQFGVVEQCVAGGALYVGPKQRHDLGNTEARPFATNMAKHPGSRGKGPQQSYVLNISSSWNCNVGCKRVRDKTGAKGQTMSVHSRELSAVSPPLLDVNRLVLSVLVQTSPRYIQVSLQSALAGKSPVSLGRILVSRFMVPQC